MLRFSRLISSRMRVPASVLALLMLGGATWLVPATVAPADTTLSITIHYYRYDHNYSGWDVWSWNDLGDGGTAHAYNGSDSFGQEATYTQDCNACTQIGFIVRYGGSQWTNREPS